MKRGRVRMCVWDIREEVSNFAWQAEVASWRRWPWNRTPRIARNSLGVRQERQLCLLILIVNLIPGEVIGPQENYTQQWSDQSDHVYS